MADFFQPKDAKGTESSTPSPAAQAMAKFRASILDDLLNYAAKPRTTFKQFSQGKPTLNAIPGGLGDGAGAILEAMNQPGAFTSTKSFTGRGITPSMFSDIAQLGLLGAQIYQSKLGQDALGWILGHIGGAQGIGGVNPALGDTVGETDTAGLDPALFSLLGDGVQPGSGADSFSLGNDTTALMDPDFLSLLL